MATTDKEIWKDIPRYESDLERILIPRECIAKRVRELAQEISLIYEDDEDDEITIIAILSGSLVFLADLIRELPLRMKIGLITVSNYPGETIQSMGAKIQQDLNINIANRHVLLIDDILDTGKTLRIVYQRLTECSVKSIRTCVLLRKPIKAPSDVSAEFIGFDIEDKFVVGYGLDYNDHYRNLPDIGILRPELYMSN